jgi:hypothetical protein
MTKILKIPPRQIGLLAKSASFGDSSVLPGIHLYLPSTCPASNLAQIITEITPKLHFRHANEASRRVKYWPQFRAQMLKINSGFP